jgi:hypothetical protein
MQDVKHEQPPSADDRSSATMQRLSVAIAGRFHDDGWTANRNRSMVGDNPCAGDSVWEDRNMRVSGNATQW